MFTERLNELLTEIFRTSTGEFSAAAGYERSYLSRLRSGNRVLRPGHSAAVRLVDTICRYAEEKGVRSDLCARIGIPEKADKETFQASLSAWLFEGMEEAAEKRKAQEIQAKERFSRSGFGNRLSKAMELADLSSLRLARALNVDASLISKYRSGLRVPRTDHPIIGEISRVLAKQICDMDRAAALAQLVGEPLQALSPEEVARLLEIWLREPDAVDTSLIEDLLEKLDTVSPQTGLPCIPVSALPQESPQQTEETEFQGHEGLRRAVRRFLCEAIRSKQPELWLFSEQNMDWMTEDRDFFLQWAALMNTYVSYGGKIRIIHHIDRGLKEMASAIQGWLPLYLSGRIESWYCRRQGGDRFSHTVFLAPGKACIAGICFVGKETDASYCYSIAPSFLESMTGLFEDLLSECRPLMTLRSDGGTHEQSMMLKGDAVYSIERSLSLGTMPQDLLQTILERSGLPEETAGKILAEWSGQKKMIEEKLETGEIHEYVVLRGQQELAERKTELSTQYAQLHYTPEEYVSHIRALIELQEKQPHFRIFVLKEAPFEQIQLIAARHSAVITHPAVRPMAFTTVHPQMCRAFIDFAKRLEAQYEGKTGDSSPALQNYVTNTPM